MHADQGMSPQSSIVRDYLNKLKILYGHRQRLTEHAAAHVMMSMLNEIKTFVGLDGFSVYPEMTHKGLGRPDITFISPSDKIHSFIEMKAPHVNLGEASLKGLSALQFARYANSSFWIYTNFLEFRAYDYEFLSRKVVLADQDFLSTTKDLSDDFDDRVSTLLSMLRRIAYREMHVHAATKNKDLTLKDGCIVIERNDPVESHPHTLRDYNRLTDKGGTPVCRHEFLTSMRRYVRSNDQTSIKNSLSVLENLGFGSEVQTGLPLAFSAIKERISSAVGSKENTDNLALVFILHYIVSGTGYIDRGNKLIVDSFTGGVTRTNPSKLDDFAVSISNAIRPICNSSAEHIYIVRPLSSLTNKRFKSSVKSLNLKINDGWTYKINASKSFTFRYIIDNYFADVCDEDAYDQSSDLPRATPELSVLQWLAISSNDRARGRPSWLRMPVSSDLYDCLLNANKMEKLVIRYGFDKKMLDYFRERLITENNSLRSICHM